MTRQEKLAACDAYFLPIIATKTTAKDNAFENYQVKLSNYQEALFEYEQKKSKINEYYDALDKIAELQKITEPAI